MNISSRVCPKCDTYINYDDETGEDITNCKCNPSAPIEPSKLERALLKLLEEQKRLNSSVDK